MDNWQSKFAPHILDRGKKYYRRGLVGDLEKNEYGYSAVVYGTNEYNVRIIIEDQKLIDMTCTCPYAESGENCKHMAAVIMEIETPLSDNAILFTDKKAKLQDNFIGEWSGRERAEELVANASFEEIETFLISELENDERMLHRFKLFTTNIITENELKMYKEQLMDIFEEYQDKNGFVSYYMADELKNNLYAFINTVIYETLLEYSKHEEAFLLTVVIVNEFNRLDIDDSNGITVDVIYTCQDILTDIISKGNDILENRIFDWLEKQIVKTGNDFVYDIIKTIWLTHFHKLSHLERKRLLALKKIKEYESDEDDTYKRYYLEKWIDVYLEISDEMDIPEKEMSAFRNKYWNLPNVRQRAVERCIKKGNDSEAIKILIESKEADKDLPGLVSSYSSQLADLYEKAGNVPAFRKELIEIVTEHFRGNIESFRRLRASYSKDEWPIVRDELLNGFENLYTLAELYNEEKLYDKLIECVKQSGSIWMIERYEKALKPLYPQELLIMYENIVKENAKVAGDRDHYRSIVKLLRKMKHYPYGSESVRRIVDECRKEYKRRPAMMDELGRI